MKNTFLGLIEIKIQSIEQPTKPQNKWLVLGFSIVFLLLIITSSVFGILKYDAYERVIDLIIPIFLGVLLTTFFLLKLINKKEFDWGVLAGIFLSGILFGLRIILL